MAELEESMETFAGDDDDDEEEEVDDGAHEKLLTSIYALNGKKRHTNIVRGLPSTSSSVDLVIHAKGTSKIQPEDLNIKQKSSKSFLKKPRSQLELEKAQRQVARETLESEMSRWEPVVQEIRSAPQTIFAKKPHGIKMYEAVQPKPFTPRTPLEMELFEALGKSEDIIRPDQELTVAEQRALKAMSFKEAKQRRAELLKHHELLSRMELKAKWQNKIKSKRYRKIMRKEKVMAEKKLLEQLQKTHPEVFLEKLEQIERDRMEERLTLKHRGGGRFSRLHKAYSKFDDKTRAAVQEMLQKSRELTKKQPAADSSDDENDDIEPVVTPGEAGRQSQNMKESDDEDTNKNAEKTEARASQLDFFKAVNKKAGGWLDVHKTTFVYKQPASETHLGAQTNVAPETHLGAQTNVAPETHLGAQTNIAPETHLGAQANVVESVSIDSPVKNSGLEKNSSQVKSVEDPQTKESQPCEDGDGDSVVGAILSVLADCSDVGSAINNCEADATQQRTSLSQLSTSDEPKKKKQKRSKKKKKDDSGNNPVVSTEKPVKEVTLQVVSGKVNDDVNVGDESDSDDGMKVTMEELFQDEDVVEEFAKEKAEAEERSRPKLEDTKLPGWGNWAGPDYHKKNKQEERRKHKAVNKARRLQLQKEKIKEPNVWLNPNRDEAIRKLQPKTVPFPYTSVQQYEASVRQPVSRGFVRETAFKLLTKPEVVTKLGHIIAPLDKDDYFKKQEIDADDMEEKADESSSSSASRQRNRQKRKSVR